MESTGSSGSPSSAAVRCQFLGSLTSARGRELLSQLCLQIAEQSKLRHHFVERKEMEKMNRHFFPKLTDKVKDQAKPFEMKVFFIRDHLERISNEKVKTIPLSAAEWNSHETRKWKTISPTKWLPSLVRSWSTFFLEPVQVYSVRQHVLASVRRSSVTFSNVAAVRTRTIDACQRRSRASNIILLSIITKSGAWCIVVD